MLGSSLNAGQDAELTLGGSYLARASAFVLGSCMAARVEGFERESPAEPEPDRGSQLIELLPFEISIPGPGYALAELGGAAAGTMISLDTPYPEGEMNGEASVPLLSLSVAGREAASGPAVVAGEKFGILVRRVAELPDWEEELRSTGAVLKAGKAHPAGHGIKLYDWRRPDCFTKAQINAIADIHTRALETLGELRPELSGFCVRAVDQMTYAEFLSEAAKIPAGFRVLSSAFGVRARSYGRDAARGAASDEASVLIQPERPSLPMPAATVELLRGNLKRKKFLLECRNVLAFLGGGNGIFPDMNKDLARVLGSAWRFLSDVRIPDFVAEAEAPVLRANERDEGGRGFDGPDTGILENGMVLIAECARGASAFILVYPAQALLPLWKVLERHGR